MKEAPKPKINKLKKSVDTNQSQVKKRQQQEQQLLDSYSDADLHKDQDIVVTAI